MNLLRLKHDYEDSAVELEGEFTDASDVHHETLDRSTVVRTPDGSLTAILLCGVIPKERHRVAYHLWKDVNDNISNRPKAVGLTATHRSTSSITGKLSPRTGVNEKPLEVLRKMGVRQGVLGVVDGPVCRKTKLTVTRPEMLDGNRDMIEMIDGLYANHIPEIHEIQKAQVKMAAKEWRLWDTAFTTVYVIKQLRTASYHRDTGNLAGGFTAITPCGNFTGGELVLLRWRIAIAYKPGDVLLFDPSQLHGNLSFVGERLSAACYCEAGIADCGNQ